MSIQRRSIFPPTTLFPRRFLLHLFFRRNSVYNCSPLGKLTVTGWEVSVQLGGPTPVTRFVGYTPHSPSSDAPSLLPASPAIICIILRQCLPAQSRISKVAGEPGTKVGSPWQMGWMSFRIGVMANLKFIENRKNAERPGDKWPNFEGVSHSGIKEDYVVCIPEVQHSSVTIVSCENI